MSDERVYISRISICEHDDKSNKAMRELLDSGESFKVTYQGYPSNVYVYDLPQEWLAVDDLEFNLEDAQIKKIVHYT